MERLSETSLEISLVTNFTQAPLELAFRELQASLGIELRVSSAGFGVFHDYVETSSKPSTKISLIVIDFDSIVESASLKSNREEKISAFELSVGVFLQKLNLHIQTVGLTGITIIAPFRISSAYRFDETIIDRSLFVGLENRILAFIDGFSDVHLLDIQTPITEFGISRSYSARSDLQAQNPLTIDAARIIAERALSYFANLKSPPFKVLMLDADNTLWRGVLGEVGSEGVGLHPTTYPGNIFWKIQRVFKSFKEAGLLLVLLTKNDLDIVEGHLKNHEAQILKEEDFVLISADWTPKADRARLIADELNLGLESIMFIDDSETEVLAMRTQVPEIFTFQVPPNISDYLRSVLHLSELLLPKASESDRTELYRVRSRTNALKTTAKTHEEFMSMLETKLIVRRNQLQDINRIAELSERTNQFNSSLNIYTADDLREKINNQTHQLWVGSVNDTIGDSGTSLAAISRIDNDAIEIEGLWVSCRVLGRHLEHAFLSVISSFGISQELSMTSITFNEGARNSQVRDFLNSLMPKQKITGSHEATHFQYASGDLVSLIPTYIKVIE